MTTTSKVLPSEVLSTLLKTYDPDTNTSIRILTKYEKTAMMGVRIEQLAQGAPSTLSDDELKGLQTVEAICEKELATKKIPFLVLRTLPSGKQEIYRVEDLSVL